MYFIDNGGKLQEIAPEQRAEVEKNDDISILYWQCCIHLKWVNFACISTQLPLRFGF